MASVVAGPPPLTMETVCVPVAHWPTVPKSWASGVTASEAVAETARDGAVTASRLKSSPRVFLWRKAT